jgi:hypothetical protein
MDRNYSHDEVLDNISIDSSRWVEEFFHEATQETESDSIDPLTLTISFDDNDHNANANKNDNDQDHFACAPANPCKQTEGHHEGDLFSVSEESTVCGAHLQKDRQMSDDAHRAVSVVVAAQPIPSQPITAPSLFDVVEGRGRGMLKLTGNAIYRELVSMNRVGCDDACDSSSMRLFLNSNSTNATCNLFSFPLCQRIYARCHKHDKSKVSKVRHIYNGIQTFCRADAR